MDFKLLATKRFSLRKFTDEAVAQADLDYIMSCVQLAPSACNRQPWKFLLLASEEAKAKIRQCYNRPWFASAPLYVLCMTNNSEGWVRPDDGGASRFGCYRPWTRHLLGVQLRCRGC